MKLSQVPLSAVLSDVSPTTIHCTFEPALKSFFSVADDRPLNDYSVIDVDRWKSEVKIGRVTLSIYFRALRSLFSRLERSGYADTNVFKKSAPPRCPQSAPIYLSEAEVRMILSSVHNKRMRAIFITLASTGMRVGECLALRWDDVDLEAKTISIRVTKTGRGRTIPISNNLMATLRKLPRDGELLWGQPISSHRVSHVFKTTVRRCGLSERYHLHSLRSTFASHLVKKGISIYSVSKLLGHSSITTTVKHYAGLEASSLHAEVNQLAF